MPRRSGRTRSISRAMVAGWAVPKPSPRRDADIMKDVSPSAAGSMINAAAMTATPGMMAAGRP